MNGHCCTRRRDGSALVGGVLVKPRARYGGVSTCEVGRAPLSPGVVLDQVAAVERDPRAQRVDAGAIPEGARVMRRSARDAVCGQDHVRVHYVEVRPMCWPPFLIVRP